MSEEEHWGVTVTLHRKMATCIARKAGRKHSLVFFYSNGKFLFSNKSSKLASPLEQVPPDKEEIKAACLRAIAVKRLTG